MANRGVDYTDAKLDELHFDPSNPRFGRLKRVHSSDEIQSLLEKEPHLALELVDSFLVNGFIRYEPLVVRHRTGGGYVVVEGNRRLAALRHIAANRAKYEALSSKDRVESLAKNIPILVFPQGADEEQRVYLGVRHLFGFRDWPAESKAEFLDSQVSSKQDVDNLVRELNIKRHDLRRYLVPYRLRQREQDLWAPHKDQDFWVLGEGLSRSGISEYIELAIDKDTLEVKDVSRPKLKQLLTMVYGSPSKKRDDRRIEESRDLSKLATALSHTKARAALEKGRPLEEATILVDSPDQAVERLKKQTASLKTIVGGLKKRNGGEDLATAFAEFAKAVTGFVSNVK